MFKPASEEIDSAHSVRDWDKGVSPPKESVVVLTQRFRGRVIRYFLGGRWEHANEATRESVRLLTGKEADGTPLADQRHLHARFGVLFDQETERAARLLVWHSQPFTDAEHCAILTAAEQELPLAFTKAGTRDPWAVRLLPLDSRTPPPAGFGERTWRHWKTMVPYVPPRHVFKRKGRTRAGESPMEQLRLELTRQGYDTGRLTIDMDDQAGEWIRVHRPLRQASGAMNTERLGYHVFLSFDPPVRDPISLGHSSHFGLGLFVGVDEQRGVSDC